MTSRPVTVIGLDAMDPDLVARWIDAGELPQLARIMRQSARGRVTNPPWLEAGSTWSTFFRGALPDQTGLWDGASRFDPTLYDRRTVRPDEVAVPKLWQTLANRGRRITLVDPPYELLSPGLHGVQIVDWLTHVRTGNKWLLTQPRGIAREIRRRWGENPWASLPHNCPTNLVSVESVSDVETYCEKLLRRVVWKTELAKSLLGRERSDLFCVVFHDAHDVGHMCWHIHDPTHERHNPEVADQMDDPLLRIYQALDAAVGELLSRVEDTNIIVLFSHGMEKQRTATRLLDRMLAALATGHREDAVADSDGFYANVYRGLVPGKLRSIMSGTPVMRRIYEQKARQALYDRPFFELTPQHSVGGVRLNLKGREQYGVLEPGTEAEDVLARLTEQLAEIKNVDSGEPLVDEIVQTSEVYAGPEARQLPDLMLRWNRGQAIRRVYSPRFGTLDDMVFRPRSGDHLADGMFFATGPDFDTSARQDVDMTEFAATIGALLDVDYEGEPIAPLVFLDRH